MLAIMYGFADLPQPRIGQCEQAYDLYFRVLEDDLLVFDDLASGRQLPGQCPNARVDIAYVAYVPFPALLHLFQIESPHPA